MQGIHKALIHSSINYLIGTIYMLDRSNTKMRGHSFCSCRFCYRLKGNRGIVDKYWHVQNDWCYGRDICNGQWREALSLRRSGKAYKRRGLNWVLIYGLESTQGPSRNAEILLSLPLHILIEWVHGSDKGIFKEK